MDRPYHMSWSCSTIHALYGLRHWVIGVRSSPHAAHKSHALAAFWHILRKSRVEAPTANTCCARIRNTSVSFWGTVGRTLMECYKPPPPPPKRPATPRTHSSRVRAQNLQPIRRIVPYHRFYIRYRAILYGGRGEQSTVVIDCTKSPRYSYVKRHLLQGTNGWEAPLILLCLLPLGKPRECL